MSQPHLNVLNESYKLNDLNKTPYQTFLTYSDSKQQVSNKLSEVISEYAEKRENAVISILDIGCGTGEIIVQSIQELLRSGLNVSLTGLDLSSDMIEKYSQTFGDFPKDNLNLGLINSHWLDTQLNSNYNIIVASHIHLDRNYPSPALTKMLNHLEPSGVALFVNNTDDILNLFKNTFRPKIFGLEEAKAYPPLLSQDVRKFILDLNRNDISIGEIEVPVNINFPDTNSEEFKKLLSFLIGKNTQWKTLSKQVQSEIIEFISQSGHVFRGKESILLVKKNNQ